jgi:hypothetical protein
MSEIRIAVIAYSCDRDEEIPRTIFLYEKKIEILEILKRWTEEGVKDRRRRSFFKVKGSDGLIHTIHYDEKFKEWFCKVDFPQP